MIEGADFRNNPSIINEHGLIRAQDPCLRVKVKDFNKRRTCNNNTRRTSNTRLRKLES